MKLHKFPLHRIWCSTSALWIDPQMPKDKMPQWVQSSSEISPFPGYATTSLMIIVCVRGNGSGNLGKTTKILRRTSRRAATLTLYVGRHFLKARIHYIGREGGTLLPGFVLSKCIYPSCLNEEEKKWAESEVKLISLLGRWQGASRQLLSQYLEQSSRPHA